VIIEVLIAERDPVNALPQEIDLRVRDQIGMARIGDPRIERADQTEPAIGRTQHHHPAVTGDIAPGKTGLDFAPIKAWKSEKFSVTIWH
jgi:hypothetical protein